MELPGPVCRQREDPGGSRAPGDRQEPDLRQDREHLGRGCFRRTRGSSQLRERPEGRDETGKLRDDEPTLSRAEADQPQAVAS